MNPKEQIAKAHLEFKEAAIRLADLAYVYGDEWNECLDETYPFNQCFTEVAYDIQGWGGNR